MATDRSARLGPCDVPLERRHLRDPRLVFVIVMITLSAVLAA